MCKQWVRMGTINSAPLEPYHERSEIQCHMTIHLHTCHMGQGGLRTFELQHATATTKRKSKKSKGYGCSRTFMEKICKPLVSAFQLSHQNEPILRDQECGCMRSNTVDMFYLSLSSKQPCHHAEGYLVGSLNCGLHLRFIQVSSHLYISSRCFKYS